MSPVLITSLILQLIIFAAADRLPEAYPTQISRRLTKTVGLLAIAFTGISVSIIGLLLDWGAAAVVRVLVTAAILPPMTGLITYLWAANGKDIYAIRRFLPHLVTNVLGALAASAFVWAATSTPGFDDFSGSFDDDAAFNIVLPMAAAVAIAFARSEQAKHAGRIDLGSASDDVAARATVGYSLRHLHQLMNTIFLMVVIFVAGATVLYLFAETVSTVKQGEPPAVSLPVIAAVACTLLFLLACGLPGSRESRTVWMTFATGTPAGIAFSLVWIALFEGSTLRNLAIGVIVASYVAYSVEYILAERSHGGTVEAHYFSSVVVALALAMLLGAIYVS